MEFLFKEWQDQGIPELIGRDLDITLPDKVRKITTITGIRRAGKTYAMFYLIKKLSQTVPKDTIFYINFEDERIERKKESLTKLVPALLRLYGGKKEYYLFLDELQVMPEWSVWLRRIHDNYRNIKLFVSGSSSRLSSREIPTELRGRALNHEIFPLSFTEFLRFKGISLDEHMDLSERKIAEIKSGLDEYLGYGGFPEIVLSGTAYEKKRIAQEYFRTIISRDIAERYNVKRNALLHSFLQLLLNTTDFSANKSANVLHSQGLKAGKETILNFTKYAQDSYFCMFVPMFSYKMSDQLRYPRKVYFADNAFLSCLSLKFSGNLGRLYENLVAMNLYRTAAREPGYEIYYWKNPSGKECDFVIKDGQKVRRLIQVCYDITDFDTKKRETSALITASKELGCDDLLIITSEYQSEEKIDGMNIKFVPLWKWLLDWEYRKNI